MSDPDLASTPPLRIFCPEDNPVIVLHAGRPTEDPGHVFTGASGSFADLQKQLAETEMDGALVAIDLADGSTGSLAAAWFLAHGVRSAREGVDVC